MLVGVRRRAAVRGARAAGGTSPGRSRDTPRARPRRARRHRRAVVLAVRLPHEGEPALGVLLAADEGVGAGGRRLPGARRARGPAAGAVGGRAARAGRVGRVGCRSSPSAPRHPFPGPAALIPVRGTARRSWRVPAPYGSGPRACSGVSPMRAIGTVSYTWYLWHWPVLILAPYVVGHALEPHAERRPGLVQPRAGRLTTVLVEQPRCARPGCRRSGRAVSWRRGHQPGRGGHGGLGGRGGAASRWAAAPPRSPTCRRRRAPGGRRSATSATATAGGSLRRRDGLNAQVNRQVYESLANPDVPANLSPSLTDAASDLPVPEDNGCLNGFTDAAGRIRASTGTPALRRASCSSATRMRCSGSRPSTTWRTNRTTPWW